MAASVPVGYLQMNPAYLEVSTNVQAVGSQISSLEVELLVLPELFTSGYFFRSKEHLDQVAEPVPGGPSTETLKKWARSLEATLVAGLPEREGGSFYNTAVVVTPAGGVGKYRKVHLYYEEKQFFEPGDLGFPVFDVTTGSGTTYRLGVMVCFDWYFPEAARTLALKGADVIAHPSNLVLPYCPESMPVRARENHLFTITANRYGSEQKGEETLTFIGMSEICDPSGTIERRADRTGDSIGLIEIDPHSARDRRINEYNDVLADRRPEAYRSHPENREEVDRQSPSSIL